MDQTEVLHDEENRDKVYKIKKSYTWSQISRHVQE